MRCPTTFSTGVGHGATGGAETAAPRSRCTCQSRSASFLVSAVVTHWAETGARHLTADRGSLVALTTAAFLVVSGVFFVLKFVIYETFVFTRALDAELDVDCLVRSGPVEPSLVEPSLVEPSPIEPSLVR